MKAIKIHLTAFAVLLPLLAVVSTGNLAANFLGVLYAAGLYIYTANSERGKRFIRRYYREVLRLEDML